MAKLLVAALFLGVCGGLVVLSRTDAVVLIPLIMLIVAVSRAPSSRIYRILLALVFGVVVLAFLSLWWGYAWKHTGQITQGSAAIKMEWRKEMMAQQGVLKSILSTLDEWWSYVYKSFFKVAALKWVLSALPLLLLLPDRSKRPVAERWLVHLLWVFPLGIGLAYALFMERSRTWYYVPALVSLTLFAAGCAYQLYTATNLNRLQGFARQCLPLIAWVTLIESAGVFAWSIVYGRSADQAWGVQAAKWIEENIPPGTIAGCWHSGIPEYYTPSVPIINLDGLANNEILPVERGEKTMNQYWDERGITVILGTPRKKMTGYAERWDGKHLEPWGDLGERSHLVQRVVADP